MQDKFVAQLSVNTESSAVAPTSVSQPSYYRPTAPSVSPPPPTNAGLEQMMHVLIQKFSAKEAEMSSLRN